MVQNPDEEKAHGSAPVEPEKQPQAAQAEKQASVPGANPAQPMQSPPGTTPAQPAQPEPARPAQLEGAKLEEPAKQAT